MTNVVDLKTKPRRSRASVHWSARTAHARGMQLRANAEVYRSILLLDLAAQHAREIEIRITDPDVRRAFETHIDAIEEAIQIARERALEL